MFFWMYMLIELLAIFLDSGVIPTANVSYPVSQTHCHRYSEKERKKFNQSCQWFAAVYTGLVAATYCCLLVNGFVGFQFAEDGTPLSLWVRPHGNMITPLLTPSRSFSDYLALVSLVSHFSSPLPRSNRSPPSPQPNPPHYLWSTSFGQSYVSQSTHYLSSFSSSGPWMTDGHWVTSFSASLSTPLHRSSSLPLARQYVTPSSTISMVYFSLRCACFSA